MRSTQRSYLAIWTEELGAEPRLLMLTSSPRRKLGTKLALCSNGAIYTSSYYLCILSSFNAKRFHNLAFGSNIARIPALSATSCAKSLPCGRFARRTWRKVHICRMCLVTTVSAMVTATMQTFVAEVIVRRAGRTSQASGADTVVSFV